MDFHEFTHHAVLAGNAFLSDLAGALHLLLLEIIHILVVLCLSGTEALEANGDLALTPVTLAEHLAGELLGGISGCLGVNHHRSVADKRVDLILGLTLGLTLATAGL